MQGQFKGEKCFVEERSPRINSVNSAQVNGVALTSVASPFHYQWESSSGGVTWNAVLGAVQAAYTPPVLIQTTHFRRRIENLYDTGCFKTSNQVTIAILADLIPGAIEQEDQYFCLGNSFPTLTVTNSIASPNVLYQWQQSTVQDATYTNINFATNEEYTPTNLTTTTFFRRVAYYNTPSSCTTSTQPVKFTLMDLDPGSLDTALNTNICYNTIPMEIANGGSGRPATTNVGSITYAWQQSTDNVHWTLISGEDQLSYSPPALQQSTYYRRVAINRQGSDSCSSTTNALLIGVYDEVAAGTLLGDQLICMGGVPSSLSLSGATLNAGTRYEWQMSTDNANFTTISNTLPTLSFPATATWLPTETTYYRAIVRNLSSPGCTTMSNAVQIYVAPLAAVVQTSGPGPQQTICPGDPIENATFSVTGSATTLSVAGIAGTDLLFTGPVAGVYTLSGTPTANTTINIIAQGINPCTDASYPYSVLLETVTNRPDFIRKNTNTLHTTIFQDGG